MNNGKMNWCETINIFCFFSIEEKNKYEGKYSYDIYLIQKA